MTANAADSVRVEREFTSLRDVREFRMDGYLKFVDRKGRAGAGRLLILAELGHVAERFAFIGRDDLAAACLLTLDPETSMHDAD